MHQASGLLGVVLCGGSSSRMGQDKGLLERQGVKWVQIMSNMLTEVLVNVVYSVNSNQLSSYQLQFPDVHLVVDEVAINGPMRGILSVHKQFPEHDLLVAGCDLIDLKPVLIHKLKNADRLDAVVYSNHGELEPLCAIYSASFLNQIVTKLQLGELQRNSMKYLISLGNTQILPLSSTDAEQLKNYNEPVV